MDLKELRKNAKLRQGKAASVLGVHRKTLHRYERGERLPPKRLWEKIATLYGCSVLDVASALAETMTE